MSHVAVVSFQFMSGLQGSEAIKGFGSEQRKDWSCLWESAQCGVLYAGRLYHTGCGGIESFDAHRVIDIGHCWFCVHGRIGVIENVWRMAIHFGSTTGKSISHAFCMQRMNPLTCLFLQYNIGDRIHISNVENETSPDGSAGMFDRLWTAALSPLPTHVRYFNHQDGLSRTWRYITLPPYTEIQGNEPLCRMVL